MSWLCCFARPCRPESPPIRGVPTTNSNNHHDRISFHNDDGYRSTVSLPRYTPRPVSIHEKTLAAHMRDPPISSSSSAMSSYPDEKSRNEYHSSSNNPEDLTSDVSSAISFPSSYGNTSTATGETPPPPYSPRVSPAPSRSMSVSSMYPPAQMTQITQPRPVLQRQNLPSRNRGSIDQQRLSQHRKSWESR